MNYDDIVKSLAYGEKIFNLPLRVTYYARVSSESDTQLNSLDNQLSYYETYIKSKPNWQFVNGYVDEGITGVKVDKRTSFKKMIKDAKLGIFDLIITKEVSRFARDLEDSIHYIRDLRESGVGLFFENQNLNTFDNNSELILNIMFNIAQDESKKLSSRVKFGHKQAIANGHVLGSSNITGYKKEKCKLVIVEEEAKFVRIVFELYASGEYGFYKLANKLFTMGYLNKKGRIYDKDTLKRIIENPKYKGYYRANTYEIMDYRTKRRRKKPAYEQIIHKCIDDSIPNIVSEELWTLANEVLKTRTMGYENNNYWSGGVKYPFSSKIYCGEHNTNYGRTHGSKKKNRPTWSCGLYLQYRLQACSSPIIAELDLYNILSSIMSNIIPQKNNIIENMLELYNNIDKTNIYDKEIDGIERYITNIEDKKSLALDLILNGELKKEDLKTQFERFETDIAKLLNKKKDILKQREILNQNQTNIDKMLKSIQEEIEGGSLEEFIRKFVKEVIVYKIDEDRYNIKLDIFLNLFGVKSAKIKGARRISGESVNDVLYLENEHVSTIEKKRGSDKKNNFIYNVYVETL